MPGFYRCHQGGCAGLLSCSHKADARLLRLGQPGAGDGTADGFCDGLEHLVMPPIISALHWVLWAATQDVLEGPLSVAQRAVGCIKQAPAV